MTTYERRGEPLAPRNVFLRRAARAAAISATVIGAALVIGVAGYHFIAGLGWVDSILNASMILAGMGPVDTLPGDGAKLFASGYALFSGVVFLGVAGVIFAPFFHRIIHHFHLEIEPSPDSDDRERRGAPTRDPG